jgi:two-component system response regulator AtoC
MPELWILDDDKAICRTLEIHFGSLGFSVTCISTLGDGVRRLDTSSPDVMILDLGLPDGSGLELLQERQARQLTFPVIVMTGHSEMEYAIEAMKLGAFDYLQKPPDIDRLEDLISKAVSQQSLAGLVVENTQTIFGAGRIAGKSRVILELHKQIGLAARSRITVLIQGESGTGKELVARSIHHYSTPDAPFIAINCSAIVPTLIESELFGHEKGAFSGSTGRRLGVFERAGTGTIFLDEVGQLKSDVQVKLLRVLQEREFSRVGGNATVPLQARVIAASNRDLRDLTASGDFRIDLYYRLSPFEIRVPPLRERLEDLPMLIAALAGKLSRETGGRIVKINRSDLDRLARYDWPGNVRELENVVAQSMLRSSSETLNIEILPQESNLEHGGESASALPSLSEVEKRHLERVLRSTGGNLGEACRILGISRPTLRKKMLEYGIAVKSDRGDDGQ